MENLEVVLQKAAADDDELYKNVAGPILESVIDAVITFKLSVTDERIITEGRGDARESDLSESDSKKWDFAQSSSSGVKDLEDLAEFEEEEDVRRTVYWAGPGLIQERYVPSIFPAQEVPEGLRPTLAYVASEEMCAREVKTTHPVTLQPLNIKRETKFRKKKTALSKRIVTIFKRVIGIKN